VLQGSVLGPLSVVIFINDLPDFIQFATPFIYADDTKHLQAIRFNDDTIKLQSDINSATHWSISSVLPFNDSKFIHLHFFSVTTATDRPVYTINGNFIKLVSQHKDLGVTFSSDFSWSAHYNAISTKVYQTLGLIRRTFKINCYEAKKQLYLALVRLQISYCSQLWRPQLIKTSTY